MKIEMKGTNGTRSSEFKLTVVVIVLGAALCYLDKITSNMFMQLATGGAGIYAVARAIVKKK